MTTSPFNFTSLTEAASGPSAPWGPKAIGYPELFIESFISTNDDDFKNDQHRRALVHAITRRFCSLYREWYESFAMVNLTTGTAANGSKVPSQRVFQEFAPLEEI
jgi:hypothetical protein